MPQEPTPLLASQSNRLTAQSPLRPVYVELRPSPADPPARRADRHPDRDLEDPERWDGMG